MGVLFQVLGHTPSMHTPCYALHVWITSLTLIKSKTENKRRNNSHPSILISNLISNHLLSRIDHNLRRPSRLLLCRSQLGGTTDTGNRAEISTGRFAGDGNADILGRAGDALGVEAGDMDALRFVLVSRRDDLDDVIARELELGNVHGGAVHQVGVEDA